MPYLIVSEGAEARFIRIDSDRFSIGRSTDCDLALHDSQVSRRHSEIVRRSSGYAVLDCGSQNGTCVNGVRIEEAVLGPGDEIRIGESVLVFSETIAGGSDTASLDSAEQRLDVASTLRGGQRLGPDSAASERFFLLHRVCRQVLSAESLAGLLDLSLTLMLDAVGADRGVLLIRDTASGDVLTRHEAHSDTHHSGEEIRLPHTIVNEVLSSRVAVLTSDASDDPRFRDGTSVLEAHVRSAMCVPLWEEDEKVLGVVYLDCRRETHTFSREDLVLTSTIANLIASRIKREQLADRLQLEQIERASLERYHSPEVVDAILARGEGAAPGRLEERAVSILFVDVQGFTARAERSTPSEVAAFLNDYYELATRVIFDHGGTINEFIGDSVMAIFGAPIAHQDHAHRAVRAALALLAELKAQEGARSEALRDCAVHVGINTGLVVVGSVGALNRLKYAVIGDPVNVAARIERLAEPNLVTIGENTHAHVKDQFACRDLGSTTLRGREQPIRLYVVEPPSS